VKKCIGKVIVSLSKSLNYTHFESSNEIKTHFDRHFNYCYSSSYINKITGDRKLQETEIFKIFLLLCICIGPSRSGVGFAEKAWV
jgi:hypothetical protein